MKTLFATSLILLAGSFAQAKPTLILQCNSDMYNVAVTTEPMASDATGMVTLTISVSDISGHGKDYLRMVPTAAVSNALAAGIDAVSNQDEMGTRTSTATGNEKIQVSGKVATLTGELPAQVQCVDLQSDN